MEHGYRGAILRIEESDEPLVRLGARTRGRWSYADQLGAEGLGHRPRHDPEGRAVAQVDDLAQQLLRLPGRQRRHGLAHQGDAGLIGQQSPHGPAVDHEQPHAQAPQISRA